MIPIAFGSSGHKSLTSKTKVFLLNQRANIPGIPAVNGVVVANTTVGGLCYCLGCYVYYCKGYSTGESDGKGRYKQGGGIKYIGVLTGMVTCVWAGLSMAKVL